MQPCQVVDSLWSASRGFAAVEAAPYEKSLVIGYRVQYPINLL